MDEIRTCEKNNDVKGLEFLLRSKYISKDIELDGSIDNEFARQHFLIMKARHEGIVRTLNEIASVMSFDNIIEEVLNYLPDLKYFDITTNDTKKIKKNIVKHLRSI